MQGSWADVEKGWNEGAGQDGEEPFPKRRRVYAARCARIPAPRENPQALAREFDCGIFRCNSAADARRPPAAMTPEPPPMTVRVWDLPTRAFHWALALGVVASVTSAWIGGNAMTWHFRFGYAIFTLLAFRLVWGVVGGHWSRFARFTYAPATTLRYVRGQSRPDEHHEVGHSPLGALSVFSLLGVLGLQVATGLFADDEIANSGPLVKFVSGKTSLAMTHWHSGYGQWVIIALVALHLGAIGYYLIAKRRNLIGPMLTGDKQLDTSAPQAVDTAAARAFALVLLALCAALVGWVVGLGE
jgi:cytochrome b